MRLERLEISGFKSFSDRAELAFDRGVTAIVGPNGCGKSNVADAITWVLGEQSAKSLRGEKMEDVIFNGSDARKAGATAEVRLRLGGLPVPPKVPVDSVAGVLAVGEVLVALELDIHDADAVALVHVEGERDGGGRDLLVHGLDRGVLRQRLVQVPQLAVDAGHNDVAALKKEFRAGGPGSHLGLFAIDEKGDLLGI